MPVFNVVLKLFIVIMVGFLFLYILGKIPPRGAIGFRPIDQGCYGITFKNEEVYRSFPKGRIWIKTLNLEYYVPDEKEKKSKEGFCLGKNFWEETKDKNIEKELTGPRSEQDKILEAKN